MTETATYVLARQFNAPRAQVWKAWTDKDLLARWYGPGIETVIHEYDLRAGGVWKNEMRMGEKGDFSLMTFREVVAEERLVWLHASTNANWQTQPSAMMPDWPQTILTTVTFEEADGGTKVTLTWEPEGASEAELATFNAMKDRFGMGWGAGYKIIDEILAEMGAS